MRNRVVITGTGYITSLGCTSEELEKAVRSDTPAFTHSTSLEGCIECPIADFDLTRTTGRWKHKRYLARGAQLALSAALRAAKDSNLHEELLESAGLFTGVGPNLDIGADFPDIQKGHMNHLHLPALWMLRYLPNTTASAISQFLNIHGENSTIGTACSASTQALGEAFRRIKDGYLTTALAGGGDSRLSHGGLLGYNKAQALWNKGGDPDNACRPFDENRAGFIAGEGGAMFVLESLEQAQARGAHILAEICGYGASMDAHAMTAPHPEGRYAEQAVRSALAEAGMAPDEINLISAHGTSTPLNDQMEAGMIDRVFYAREHSRNPVVTAIKSWIGHCSAAAGAVELSILIALHRNGLIPPIRNLSKPCNANIDYETELTAPTGNNILLENFGFGGQNSALILRIWQ